jgi:hypothetical protein
VKHFGIILCFCSLHTIQAQHADEARMSIDLKPRWSFGSSDANRFDPRSDRPPESIFFHIDPALFADGRLVIAGAPVEAVWIDGVLASAYRGWSGALDSLRNTGEAIVCISVLFKPGQQDQVQTYVQQPGDSEVEQPRLNSALRDFVFTAVLILVILWSVLSWVQSKLAVDYVAFYKAFALHESEDRLQRSRMGGSGNLPFYLFTALVVSFLLLLAFHHSGESFAISGGFRVSGVGQGLLSWATLFTGVVIFIAGKLALVSLLGILFDVWEFSVVQFFSFVQILLGVAVVGLLAMVLYFASHGANPAMYRSCILAVWVVLAVWMATLFIRLIRQKLGRPFYLFSYLCATEIIPLLITLGVVYTD